MDPPQPLPPANCTPQGGAFVNWQILRKKPPLPRQAAVWSDREGAGGWVHQEGTGACLPKHMRRLGMGPPRRHRRLPAETLAKAGMGLKRQAYKKVNTHSFLCIKSIPTLQFWGVGTEMVWSWRGVESRCSSVFLWD